MAGWPRKTAATGVPIGEARSDSKEGQACFVRFLKPILVRTLLTLRPQAPPPPPPSHPKKLGGTLHGLSWLGDGSWHRRWLARSGIRQTCHPVRKFSPTSRVVPAWGRDPYCARRRPNPLHDLVIFITSPGIQRRRRAGETAKPLRSLLPSPCSPLRMYTTEDPSRGCGG
ncbi:hypothetical protein LX36DRAFT_154048 [Colletotrichum falcatum]|nr:hypothetical protein LX36DRAFT_154048 [Colletotrichum falcatum]